MLSQSYEFRKIKMSTLAPWHFLLTGRKLLFEAFIAQGIYVPRP